uniref:Cystatin domain-containing protein n=1 Tax=Leersia perrieri TaxID=77586 RepID=A0A0D9WYJ2_9ORYZ
MTTRSFFLAAIGIIAVCAAAVTAPGARAAAVDAWSPIKNINDPYIQKLGWWAVSEENKVSQSGALTFSKVTGGEQQLQDIADMKYRLYIDASSGNDKNGSYMAVVLEQANTRKLISFSMSRC